MGEVVQLERVFQYEGSQVRTVVKDGEPWFVAKDVCEVLGYAWNGTARIEHVPAKWRGATSVVTPSGTQEMAVLSEQGLYFFLGRSDKPKALPFQMWIAGEVVPAIHKHGIYATDEVIDNILGNPDFGIRLLTELKTERAHRKELEAENAELRPKASYCDLVLQSESLVSITQIAKDYGLSGKAMNILLHDLGIQYRQGDTWVLYQKYAEMGLAHSRTHAINEERSAVHTYWTQKGRMFLYNLLKEKRGLLPLVERQNEKGA